MKQPVKVVLAALGGVIAGAALISSLAFDKSNPGNDLLEVKGEGRLQYKWFAPELPKTMSFANEAVPLDRWDVRERLDREILMNYYMHGSTLYILKLTTRYFPQIEAKLKANGIPDDFKYLCVAESSLQHVSSSAGAQSFWQFLGGTATEYGLQVDGEVDERYDVDKATDAACKYFQTAYDRFGSWTAAAASYNCGLGGYSNQMNYQGSKNYYDLLLPEETNRYIFRILALKYLILNSVKMGYNLTPHDSYKPLQTRPVQVTESIPNLADWAQTQGVTYKTLRIYNPWLRSKTLTVKGGKSYEIDLPM
jgi:hypothetical protein